MKLRKKPTHPATPTQQHKLQKRRTAWRNTIEIGLLAFVVFGLLAAFLHNSEAFSIKIPLRVLAGTAIVIFGWGLARNLGRWEKITPRLDPSTVGTVRFVIRLLLLGVTVFVALSVIGFDRETLALGGAITGIVVGLASQQTLGNVFAGLVLISARPFQVGDRLQLQAGGLAGTLEGVVVSLGLLYTTLARGEDSVMVPNTVVLSAAVVPLKEPAAIDLRARLRPDVTPSEVQTVLDAQIKTPVREDPHIELQEVKAEEIVVRVAATPIYEADGRRLADEILSAIGSMTGEVGSNGDNGRPVRNGAAHPIDPLTQEYES